MTEVPGFYKHCRIAVQMMIELASNDDLVPLYSIAARLNERDAHLEKIAAALQNRVLIEGGDKGTEGCRLAKPADRITIGEIVGAIGYAPRLAPDRGDPAEVLWEHISNTACQQLSDITLAETLASRR
jgi:DNA-binding IscR family transcriptional regulator